MVLDRNLSSRMMTLGCTPVAAATKIAMVVGVVSVRRPDYLEAGCRTRIALVEVVGFLY